MSRIAKVLIISVLMVVLMATTVSPAFAKQSGSEKHGWGDNCHGQWGNVPGCGWAVGRG